jgi:hypothetical protein
MKRRAVFLVIGFALGFAIASADETFLDRKLPTTWACYQSRRELLQILESVVPKPFILPVGMSVTDGMPVRKSLINPTEAEKMRAGGGGLFGRVSGDKTPFTVRDYLNRACREIGMTWKYDATRDAVMLDYLWHVSDPRSNAELMETLLRIVPPEDEKHLYTNTVDSKTDPWRAAFNALLSKPENFADAWKMRWPEEVIANPGLPPDWMQPRNLFTGKILDETGATHFLILNCQEGLLSPSASIISFYLFTATGNFEQGGFFYAEDGHTEGVTAELETDKRDIIVHSGTDPSYNQYDQVFVVEKARFVFKNHLMNGKPTKPYFPFRYLLNVTAD